MLLTAGAVLVLFSSSATASKEAVAFIPPSSGSPFGDSAIAVNYSGVGPGDAGDLYIAGNHRIQRFSTDDNNTPGNPYDDTYPFASAWGADVDSTPTGGSDYEICTLLAECKAGVASGGNGTAAGNGSLSDPVGIAVDQDTGNVYVADRDNDRVSVYSGDGTFLRSFGWDVVASGPGDSGTAYEICVAAEGDVCKTGLSGAGIGQLDFSEGIAVSPPDGNPTSGTLYVTDSESHRVNTYALDGTLPSSFGNESDFRFGSSGGNLYGPVHVAVDSRGIVYIESGNQPEDWRIARYDSQNANGGGVGFLAPIAIPPLLTGGGGQVNGGLQVDPDGDGPGPETDVLYALRGSNKVSRVQQFGPVNLPGLSTPPVAADDAHGVVIDFSNTGGGLALDVPRARLFVNERNSGPTFGLGRGIYVLDDAGGTPTASLDSITDITSTTVTAHITVDPNGPPPVSFRLEYSTDGSTWIPLPETVVGSQEDPQGLDVLLDPPGTGFLPDTEYHVRMVVTKVFNPPVTIAPVTFTTLAAPPEAETTGAPVRTTTTAQLSGRVNPRGAATTYHFEYGSQGPCDANPCASTPSGSAGSGQLVRFVSEEITGLQSDTTYHYRLVADNGNSGSPALGEDLTVTTRDSDAPLSHGDFPGPPGSDRAYEQVSAPDTSGNPVVAGLAFSNNGDRAAYQVAGGTPNSNTGTAFSLLFAERPTGAHPETGWETSSITPPRKELSDDALANWLPPVASDDLSTFAVQNLAGGGLVSPLFRLHPGGSFAKLREASDIASYAMSDDGSRVVMYMSGSHDPDHPSVPGDQLYDVTSGVPELISLLPDGSVPTCDVKAPHGTGAGPPARSARWVSPDGSLAFFQLSCAGLHIRDIEADTTKLIGGGQMIKSIPGAVFFLTSESLDPQDSGGSDVYRYHLKEETRECVTCVTPGLDADVFRGNSLTVRDQVAVADDGSRVYFKSPNVLLPGAAPGGVYRVEVESGELAFVANIGPSLIGGSVGEAAESAEAITPDGSVILFGSSDPSLNQLGGANNDGTLQYYRYDDTDRSLVCVSCPQDGSPPLASVDSSVLRTQFGVTSGSAQAGPNRNPLTTDGAVAFATPTPLVGADQNTPSSGRPPEIGADIYEWRDGRLLLVTDGLTAWPSASGGTLSPQVEGFSPSGRDLFFTASTQLTPDALDGFQRLYDARVGGGIDFPAPSPPCPLEVCQGTPKGSPEEPQSASSTFTGAGNLTAPPPALKCRRNQRRVRRAGKVRCVKRPSRKHRADRNRRAVR